MYRSQVLVIHKPFIAFNTSEVGVLTQLFREHCDNKGLFLPAEEKQFRRPRTRELAVASVEYYRAFLFDIRAGVFNVVFSVFVFSVVLMCFDAVYMFLMCVVLFDMRLVFFICFVMLFTACLCFFQWVC